MLPLAVSALGRRVWAAIAPLVMPLLLAALAATTTAALWQTHQLGKARKALDLCTDSIKTAQADSAVRAATTGREAVTDYVQTEQRDAPIVERVVTRTLNVCLRPAGDLPVPGLPAGDRQAAARAQDDADRAAWLGAVAEDLRTCANALNICRAQYDFHKANTGTVNHE